jgi:hypothetical protein
VDVSLVPGKSEMMVRVGGDPSEAARWSLTELCPGPGYVAVLAGEGHCWQPIYWQWPDPESIFRATGERGLKC